jgi:DNA-binding IclR family transcriptional regulator
VDKIHPYLIELSEKTGETASLMTLEGDHGIYADQVLSKSMIRGQPRVGMRLDLHCSSAGKILLSGLEDSRIDSIFENQELKKFTAKTINTLDKLKKEVQKVRDQGYAVDDEEVEVGGRCIAAPLKGKNGDVIAAISVMGPTTRIRQKDFVRISTIVKEVARKASESFGYRGG